MLAKVYQLPEGAKTFIYKCGYNDWTRNDNRDSARNANDKLSYEQVLEKLKEKDAKISKLQKSISREKEN